ncbi:MAG TPA: flagellin [Devosia sp.]|nr:flagellin [Devosia sp.]
MIVTSARVPELSIHRIQSPPDFRAHITDTDWAQEMAGLTKEQIIQQAGTKMLEESQRLSVLRFLNGDGGEQLPDLDITKKLLPPGTSLNILV